MITIFFQKCYKINSFQLFFEDRVSLNYGISKIPPLGGGSSLVPLIKQKIKEISGTEPTIARGTFDSVEAVVNGATVRANQIQMEISGQTQQHLNSVIPVSIGIQLDEEVIYHCIRRGDTVPIRYEVRNLRMDRDLRTKLTFKLVMGESTQLKNKGIKDYIKPKTFYKRENIIMVQNLNCCTKQLR